MIQGKKFLLIKQERNIIDRFLVFSDDNPGIDSLLRYFIDDIYELNESQYQRLRGLQTFDLKDLTIKDFFIKYGIEELLI
jgi:hypothetical protein